MADPRSPWPQRTTAVGGGLLVAAAVLQLVVFARIVIPVTEEILLPLPNEAIGLGAVVLRAAGLTVLAVGVAREIGIAADSVVGRVALLLFAIVPLLQAALGRLIGAVPLPVGLLLAALEIGRAHV